MLKKDVKLNFMKNGSTNSAFLLMVLCQHLVVKKRQLFHIRQQFNQYYNQNYYYTNLLFKSICLWDAKTGQQKAKLDSIKMEFNQLVSLLIELYQHLLLWINLSIYGILEQAKLNCDSFLFVKSASLLIKPFATHNTDNTLSGYEMLRQVTFQNLIFFISQFNCSDSHITHQYLFIGKWNFNFERRISLFQVKGFTNFIQMKKNKILLQTQEITIFLGYEYLDSDQKSKVN